MLLILTGRREAAGFMRRPPVIDQTNFPFSIALKQLLPLESSLWLRRQATSPRMFYASMRWLRTVPGRR